MREQGLLVESRRAVFSEDRRYRYHLSDGAGRRVLWVMLNPSTADEVANDPTVRRCIGFTHAWGFHAWGVVNLFAWRSTDPRELARVADPVGPFNDDAIMSAARGANVAVCAWGAYPLAKARGEWLNASIRRLVPNGLHCLGRNADGSPKHPLYLPKTAQLEVWP